MNRRAFLRALALSGAASLTPAFAASPRRTNILLIYTDDQTFDSIHALGNSEICTPNLDRLVKRGTVFNTCYNQGAWHGAVCVASRTMLNTGRFLWDADAVEDHLKEEADQNRLWPQLMRKAGYHTYMTGKWHVKGIQPKDVFDEANHVRGGMPGTCEAAYERPKENETDLWQPWDESRGGHWSGGTHWSIVTADDTIDYIRRPQDNGKPFFIYTAFSEPHDPRQSPKTFVEMYPPEKIKVPDNYLPSYPYKDAMGCPHSLRDERLAPDPRTTHAVQVHRSEYYALITFLDKQIGRVLDALDGSGRAEDTCVFLTGDNGLSVGQHGLMGKQSMFEDSMRVPLIAAGPGIPQGKRIDTPVYLQDIMPTTLELAGATVPSQVAFRSLLPLIRGERATQYEAVYGAYMKLQRMIRVGDMKLIWYPKADVFLLYDVCKDPHEKNDLSKDPVFFETLAQLKCTLAETQIRMRDPLPPLSDGSGARMTGVRFKGQYSTLSVGR